MDVIIEAIKDILRPKLSTGDKAYLYGSRARGTARPDSDWDILIVLDKERVTDADHDNIGYPLREMGWDIDEIINYAMYSKADWERQKITPFYKNVQEDAIELL